MILVLEWTGWLAVLLAVLGYGRSIRLGASAGIVAGGLLVWWGLLIDTTGLVAINAVLTLLHVRNLWREGRGIGGMIRDR